MPVGPIIPPEPNVARRRPSVREGEDERGVNGVNEGGRDRDSGGSGNGERAIGTGMADQDGGAGGGGSRSPLGDLLEGENVYVERLGLIIRVSAELPFWRISDLLTDFRDIFERIAGSSSLVETKPSTTFAGQDV